MFKFVKNFTLCAHKYGQMFFFLMQLRNTHNHIPTTTDLNSHYKRKSTTAYY